MRSGVFFIPRPKRKAMTPFTPLILFVAFTIIVLISMDYVVKFLKKESFPIIKACHFSIAEDAIDNHETCSNKNRFLPHLVGVHIIDDFFYNHTSLSTIATRKQTDSILPIFESDIVSFKRIFFAVKFHIEKLKHTIEGAVKNLSSCRLFIVGEVSDEGRERPFVSSSC